MAPIKVRIEGEEYMIDKVNEMTLFPLIKVFGSDVAPDDPSKNKRLALVAKLAANREEIKTKGESAHLLDEQDRIQQEMVSLPTNKEYKKWQSRFLGRFSDPINQASTAYAIKSLIPELPESVCKYELFKMDDGDRYKVEFTFGLSAMDLLALVDAIDPLLKARKNEIDGIKPVSEVKGITPVGERAELEARLATLKAEETEV
jgi:hypothetical protein